MVFGCIHNTIYPIVTRRAWPTSCMPLGRVRRASKGILHTRLLVDHKMYKSMPLKTTVTSPLPDICQQQQQEQKQHPRTSSSLTMVITRRRNHPQFATPPTCDHCGNTGHISSICPCSANLPKMPALHGTACILTCRSGYEDEPVSNQIVVTRYLSTTTTRTKQHPRTSSSLTMVITRRRNHPKFATPPTCDHCGNTGHISSICPCSANLPKMPIASPSRHCLHSYM